MRFATLSRLLVTQAGFEPATSCSGGRRSIQLSYWADPPRKLAGDAADSERRAGARFSPRRLGWSSGGSIMAWFTTGRRLAAIVVWLALGFAAPAAGQGLQVDLDLSVPTRRGGSVRFEAPIGEAGPATLSGVARNRKGGAVQVDLVVRYDIPRDTIALDEVIERIEVATETAEGAPFLDATLETKLIPLNPNRTPLRYRVTLYRPEEGETYRLRCGCSGTTSSLLRPARLPREEEQRPRLAAARSRPPGGPPAQSAGPVLDSGVNGSTRRYARLSERRTAAWRRRRPGLGAAGFATNGAGRDAASSAACSLESVAADAPK